MKCNNGIIGSTSIMTAIRMQNAHGRLLVGFMWKALANGLSHFSLPLTGSSYAILLVLRLRRHDLVTGARAELLRHLLGPRRVVRAAVGVQQVAQHQRLLAGRGHWVLQAHRRPHPAVLADVPV